MRKTRKANRQAKRKAAAQGVTSSAEQVPDQGDKVSHRPNEPSPYEEDQAGFDNVAEPANSGLTHKKSVRPLCTLLQYSERADKLQTMVGKAG